MKSDLPRLVLDANVLYGADLRSFLLYLAEVGLYEPVWSELIQEEWLRNLLKNRPDLSASRLRRTIQVMDGAFPGAKRDGYQFLVPELTLPDGDDRHVLALAIHHKADAIVTFNQQDFPKDLLDPYRVAVYTPDKLLKLLHESNAGLVQTAFQRQIAGSTRPPLSADGLIDRLVKSGLRAAPKYLGE